MDSTVLSLKAEIMGRPVADVAVPVKIFKSATGTLDSVCQGSEALFCLLTVFAIINHNNKAVCLEAGSLQRYKRGVNGGF